MIQTSAHRALSFEIRKWESQELNTSPLDECFGVSVFLGTRATRAQVRAYSVWSSGLL